MNGLSYVVIVQDLKQCIVCLWIGIKFLGGNVRSSVLITNGYTKEFSHCLCNPTS